MAQKSNLNVPNDEPIIIIRQSLVNLTGCAVQAALLNYFDYWHFIKKESNKQSAHRNKVAERHGDRPTQDVSLLQYHTLKSIEKDMMGVAKLTKVKSAINELEKRGFISKHQNPNPRYRFDRTVYYRFHPDTVNLAIAEMQMNTQKSQTDHGAIKNDSCLDEYDSPITEYSSKISYQRLSNTDKSLPDGRALQVDNASLLENQEEKPQGNQSSVVVQNETFAKHTNSDQDPLKEKCSANLPKKKKDDFEYDDYGYVRLPCRGKNGRVGTLALKVMQLVCMAQGMGLSAGKLDGRVYIQGYMDDEWYLEDDWFKAFPFRAMRNDAETIASRFDFDVDWFNQEAIAWYEYLQKQSLPRGKFSVLEFVLKYSDDIKDEQIEWHPLTRTAA